MKYRQTLEILDRFLWSVVLSPEIKVGAMNLREESTHDITLPSQTKTDGFPRVMSEPGIGRTRDLLCNVP